MVVKMRVGASVHRLSRKITTAAESIRFRQTISEINPAINAFVCTNPLELPVPPHGGALPLSGRPIAIKDNICTKNMPTTCASGMLKAFAPPYDATVVTLLRNAGADIIGKTNCDEFGMGSLNTHSIHGPVRNPFNAPSPPSPSPSPPPPPPPHTGTHAPPSPPRSAGGSSGGSAAAVAAGLCHAALGTDTGGSTRLPAAYCGVVGLKPSYGVVSRWGVVSFADSLDCVGVMARTVGDVRRVFDVLNVHDNKDPTAASPESRRRSLEASVQSWSQGRSGGGPLDGLRIGIPQEYFPAELSPSILRPTRGTIAALRALGATIVPVSLPSTSYALSAYYVLASAEASSNLARYSGVQYGLHVPPPPGADLTKTSTLYAHSRSAGFGPEVKRRILLGTYALTADAFDNYFLQAQRVRQLVKDDFNRVFSVGDYRGRSSLGGAGAEARGDGVHVLVHPSAIRTAPVLEEESEAGSGLDAYVQDVLTVPASLAGLPGLSVPVPASVRAGGGEDDDGWPMGVGVVGQWGCDEMVLRVGEVVEGGP